VVKLEEEPSPPKIRRLLAANPELAVLGGLGGIMLLEELRAGAAGTMTGFGFPEILVDIVRRFRAGDEDGAREAFYRATPLIRFENQPVLNLPIRKLVYQRRGAIASARVRAPGGALDPGTIADLDDLLVRLDLPASSRAGTTPGDGGRAGRLRRDGRHTVGAAAGGDAVDGGRIVAGRRRGTAAGRSGRRHRPARPARRHRHARTRAIRGRASSAAPRRRYRRQHHHVRGCRSTPSGLLG
jgi:hypothetical protein